MDWSMTATNIVASKYLHGQMGTPERETGVRQLVGRVAETIRDWGMAGGYFATPVDAAVFHDELAHMLLTQKVAFNSPVWFNVGCDRLEPDADGQNWHWDPATGSVVHARPAIRIRSARPALSMRLRIRWAHSWTWPRLRAAVQVGIGHRNQFRRCVRAKNCFGRRHRPAAP